MFDAGTVRLMSGGLLAGTVAGILVLSWIVAKGRKVRSNVVAKREQALGAEQVWGVATVVVQLWSVGVLLMPAYFYAWPAVPSSDLWWMVQVAGVVLWAVGIVLVDVAAWILGRFLYTAIQVTEGHRLIQEGPYRWIRHPMYTANVAMAFGFALAYLSPPLLALAVVLLATAAYRARLEESLLRSPEAFGQVYDEYVARTGRFLPKIRRR